MTGTVHCSVVDLGMSRNGGRIIRGNFEPVRGGSGVRPGKLGITEKHFGIDQPKFKAAIESLARQL